MLMDHTSIPQLEIRADYPDASPSVARAALRDASKKLTERGLAGAAKWYVLENVDDLSNRHVQGFGASCLRPQSRLRGHTVS